MKNYLIMGMFLMGIGSAHATCEDYTDGSTTSPAPKVTLCYKGKCDETTLNVVCGSEGSGNYAEYADELMIREKSDGSPSIFTNKTGKKMKASDWTCKENDDEAGCWVGWPSVNK
jgi:hypothetical protein